MRVWRGEGTRDGVARYCDDHFPKRVLPELRTIDGFLEARVIAREGAEGSEVVVMTTWESLGALQGFAGDDYEQAVVEPVVRELLERFDEQVTHFTIVHDVR